jgi:hypothetical protein
MVGTIRDAAVIAAVVVVSFAPYVTRLAFASDDWAFLGSLHSFGDFSNVGRSAAFDFHDHLLQRPTQAAMMWLLYHSFGVHPVGYHLVNGVVLIAMAVSLYLLVVELGAPRPIGVAAAVVFVLLPTYSTDRFWFAAFGYPVTLAAYFFGSYASVRALHAWSRDERRLAWKCAAVGGMLVSGLGYEIVLPLFAANVVVLGVAAWRASRRPTAVASFLMPEVFALFGIVAFKIATAAQTGVPGNYPRYVLWLLTGALLTNVVAYGVRLPEAIRWSMARADAGALVAAGVVGVVVVWYLLRELRTTPLGSWGPGRFGRMTLAGIATFCLGYSIFLATARIEFTATGIGNRVSIAAAVGVALAAVGVFGMSATAAFRRERHRSHAFAVLVALTCAVGVLITNALALDWIAAERRQRNVLSAIRRDVGSPGDTALILDGVCPYVGAGIVFESNWDLAGALEVAFDDPRSRADVTTSVFRVGPDAVTTVLYGTHHARYAYADGVEVYDARSHEVSDLRDAQAALTWYEARTPLACPPGWPGTGTPILSTDGLMHRWEREYFWR